MPFIYLNTVFSCVASLGLRMTLNLTGLTLTFPCLWTGLDTTLTILFEFHFDAMLKHKPFSKLKPVGLGLTMIFFNL